MEEGEYGIYAGRLSGLEGKFVFQIGSRQGRGSIQEFVDYMDGEEFSWDLV